MTRRNKQIPLDIINYSPPNRLGFYPRTSRLRVQEGVHWIANASPRNGARFPMMSLTRLSLQARQVLEQEFDSLLKCATERSDSALNNSSWYEVPTAKDAEARLVWAQRALKPSKDVFFFFFVFSERYWKGDSRLRPSSFCWKWVAILFCSSMSFTLRQCVSLCVWKTYLKGRVSGKILVTNQWPL